MLIEIAPEDVSEWQALLAPLDTKPSYAALPQTFTWWVAEANFDSLQFYAPETFTYRTNGWIAINSQNGKIYIYSFTT
jgi:hypothetical protein